MKTGFFALLIAAPLAIVAAVLWWQVTLAIAAVAVAGWIVERAALRS